MSNYRVEQRVHRLPLTIAASDMAGESPGVHTYAKTATLPAGARFVGCKIGEGSRVAFADPLVSPWGLVVSLGAIGSSSVAVGPATLSAPQDAALGLAQADSIGGLSFTLTLTATGAAAACAIGGATDPAWWGGAGTLDGLTLTDLATESGGPWSVTLAAPADVDALAAQLAAGTGGGVAALEVAGHVQIVNGGSPGASSSLTIGGGTALVVLGVTAGTTTGRDDADVKDAAAGTITAALLYYPASAVVDVAT